MSSGEHIGVTPTPTTIELTRIDSGVWHATQPGVAITGRATTAARAVANYAEFIADSELIVDSNSKSEPHSESSPEASQ